MRRSPEQTAARLAFSTRSPGPPAPRATRSPPLAGGAPSSRPIAANASLAALSRLCPTIENRPATRNALQRSVAQRYHDQRALLPEHAQASIGPPRRLARGAPWPNTSPSCSGRRGSSRPTTARWSGPSRVCIRLHEAHPRATRRSRRGCAVCAVRHGTGRAARRRGEFRRTWFAGDCHGRRRLGLPRSGMQHARSCS